MTEFQQKLILIVIQYLAIALVVAFAGYLFSRALERYKARQAIESEIAKQRIKTIGECWSAIYIWEATLQDFIRRAAQLNFQYSDDREGFKTAAQAELTLFEAQSKVQSEAARRKVEENRFWVGEDLYIGFQEYYNSLMSWSSAFVEGDLSQFKTLEASIGKAKGNVVKALKALA